MTTGLKANVDGSAAIQVGGTDYIEISATGNVTIPQNQTISGPLTVTGNSTVTGTSTVTGVATLTGGVAGDFKMDSGYGSVATAYGCRAWVNFDGTANSNLTGTYSRTSPSTTLTVTATAHGLIAGNSVNLDFTTGTGLDGIYTVVTVADANTFTVTTVASTTTSGNVTLLRNTIRASGNVSSITDNGTGDYTVNFTTAMPDADYTVVANTGLTPLPGYPAPVALFLNNATAATVAPTAGAARIGTRNSAFNAIDIAYITAAIFR